MRNMIFIEFCPELACFGTFPNFAIISFLSYCVEIPARFASFVFQSWRQRQKPGISARHTFLTFELGLASSTVTRNVHELKKWRTWLQC